MVKSLAPFSKNTSHRLFYDRERAEIDGVGVRREPVRGRVPPHRRANRRDESVRRGGGGAAGWRNERSERRCI